MENISFFSNVLGNFHLRKNFKNFLIYLAKSKEIPSEIPINVGCIALLLLFRNCKKILVRVLKNSFRIHLTEETCFFENHSCSYAQFKPMHKFMKKKILFHSSSFRITFFFLKKSIYFRRFCRLMLTLILMHIISTHISSSIPSHT